MAGGSVAGGSVAAGSVAGGSVAWGSSPGGGVVSAASVATGGSVTAGMAIYDTMNFIKCDVATICVGMAASMGAFLLSAGAKGKRSALPNSEIMIHQPLGGFRGQASDIKIHADMILRTKERLNKILAENTGKSYDQICADTDRDNFLTAEEALEYGIIDKIMTKRA